MNICIIGGGNIGTAIAVELAQRNQVTMLTGRPNAWKKEVMSFDTESKEIINATLYNITNDPKSAVENADVVIMTVPSFLMEREIRRCEPYLKSGTAFCVMPGTGGVEFLCREMINNGVILVGFDRVTHVARVNVYGESANVAKKKKVRVAAIPNSETQKMATLMSTLFNMECEPLANYLTVTFTPSNPIVHTARLYDMFGTYKEGMVWDRNILFYAEWTDFASEMMLGCDDELQSTCRRIEGAENIDLSGVIPLKQHYGIKDVPGLTHKMQSITSMQSLTSPMLLDGEKYIPDFDSRYFLEDFPYGLCILKGFAELVGKPTPYMDCILKWYCDIAEKSYYTGDDFNGKDLLETAIPQNYGINSLKELADFYR